MNRLALLILIVVSTFSIAVGKDKQLYISKEKVELLITETTTEAQLRKFKKTLKEEINIDFDYKDIVFNSKNQIRKITIEVDCNDGVKESGTLMISNIYNVGFVRNYDLKSEPEKKLLHIGNITEKDIKLK